MAHWPRTVGGNLLFVALAVCAVSAVAMIAVALSGPFIWISLAAISLVSVALFVRRSRMLTARDLAVADAPSFGDVLRDRRAREARARDEDAAQRSG